jgi:hypothetical protein
MITVGKTAKRAVIFVDKRLKKMWKLWYEGYVSRRR